MEHIADINTLKVPQTNSGEFIELIDKYGLNIPDTWKNDIRKKLISMFSTKLESTKYHFEINTTDTQNKLTDLFSIDNKRRIMGIGQKQDMTLNVFFNKDFYDVISKKVVLPEISKVKGTQIYMNISLEAMWDIVCELSQE